MASFKTGRPGTGIEGQTLITDGNYSDDNEGFRTNHDHYGSGNGRNNNGTSRGRYTGPGA